MKKYFKIITLAVILGLILPSCLESYLSEAPDAGLTTDVVFSKYNNITKFFDGVYDGIHGNDYNIKCAHPLYFSLRMEYSWDAMTDMSDNGRQYESQSIKGGQMGGTVDKFAGPVSAKNLPILPSMFECIRICNMTLKNVGMLQDAQQVDIDDLIGQAHFIRAYAHFALFRIWGPMPFITKVLTPGDEFDLTRLSRNETCKKIAQDFDTAYVYFRKAGIMRRDADLQLSSPMQFRPAGVAALGMKARALLYAASPQNNKNGVTDWQDAAKACMTAIDSSKFYGFAMQTASQASGNLKQAYKNNFMNVTRTNEQLWSYSVNQYQSVGLSTMQSLTNGVFAQAATAMSGENPTQNLVDKFETKWGEPLNTPADRAAATALGHYNDQDPYSNRDPRFAWGIIYNQTSEVAGYNPANIYYETIGGKQMFSELLNFAAFLGVTRTGYYQRKSIYDSNTKVTTSYNLTDPIIRVAELYLNYAEAAAQGYGGEAGTAPGASLSAAQAVNLVRTRVGMPNLPTGLSPTIFLQRVKNERVIELCFEGHYYFDIRRWLDAPVTMGQVLYGIDIEKVPVSTTYPKGFKYLRVPLPADRQSMWKDEMYTFPFTTEDNYKMRNFSPNPIW
ncbi:MAG: RagB/SusD family nutrient uptake outer membrane protein [Mariniphaga sp.]|nr:RagB/SusD family nutrient uptake outer membrane protein [Mariniphaga sp.]